MKTWLLGILFLTSSFVFADSDYFLVGKIENIVFTALPGDESFNKNEIIAHLCNEYIKEYYPLKNLPLIYLVFADDPSVQPILEYENLNGDSWNEEIKVEKYRETGIRIKVHNQESRSEVILKLLDYAINHLDTLKARRNEIMNSKDKSRSKTLREDIIGNILSSITSVNILEIMQMKIFRGLGIDSEKSIYYYQNDVFNFHADNEIYLKIDHLYQIINIPRVGYLIFNTDSSFYFYDNHTQVISNMYSLNNLSELYKYDPFELLKYSRKTNHVKLQKGKDKVKLAI